MVYRLCRLFTEEGSFLKLSPLEICVLQTEITVQVESNIYGKSASSPLSSIIQTKIEYLDVEGLDIDGHWRKRCYLQLLQLESNNNKSFYIYSHIYICIAVFIRIIAMVFRLKNFF